MKPIDLDDDRLLERLTCLVRAERENTADVVEHLAEVERRDLARKRGFESLFDYCIKVLGYSEPSTYHRIRAARAVTKKPELLAMLRRGELHLRALVLLHPHLESEEADSLVNLARGKTKREIEAIISPLAPTPSSQDTVRVVTVSSQAPIESLPLFEQAMPAEGAVQREERVQISFTAAVEFMALLKKAQQLLWHKYPDGRLEGIFDDALHVLIERREPSGWRPRKETQSSGRTIPRWIRHVVWKRDGGQCSYQSGDGRRCESRKALEFDHIIPWAHGGSSNDPKNIRLLCRGHNQLAAREAGLPRPE